ncbi:GNAT family N-acetyltransferase [Streptomyces sp. J2-1]|uniref:GNAT family N-acetyltransferase n=1 Tax=Streptomyces corallincola TaxID=2851888 RepID=UPI001C392049|nr:GNAT family N-acetyltransferase [Streptomyces corallincola]MBV2352988.1 GNAT family N-acetyltransferase [Streptomyces corallincola]
MDHSAVLALYDRDMRQGAKPDDPGSRVERTAHVVRHLSDARSWNGILWSALDEGVADRVIAGEIAYFSGLGVDFEWKLYGHDRPHDLGARLLAAGFRAEPEETLLIAETASLDTDTPPPPGIRLLTAVDPAGVDLVVRVHEKVFGRDGDGLRHRLLAQLAAAPDTVVAVVAMDGDEPVCAARMELVPGTRFAGLWGGGTVESWRGRGLYRALVAHRARVAATRGYRYLQVDASDLSRPILERLGFHALSTTTPYLYGS